MRFATIHAYTATDVELLFNLAQAGGARRFVTTEKDAVNLGEFARPPASAARRTTCEWSLRLYRIGSPRLTLSALFFSAARK